jgi:hypothetical protein
MKRYIIISVIIAAIACIIGVFSVGRSGDTQMVIKETDRKLSIAFAPKPILIPENLKGKFKNIRQIAPAWSEVEAISHVLTWQNQEIAEAKAMMHYDSYFDGMNSYIWKEKETLSSSPWIIEENNDFYLRKLYSGVAYAAAAFVATLLCLLLGSWSWKFLLARIREVADAIRGK